MFGIVYLGVFLALIGSTQGVQKCHGHPSTYMGKPCASTTWFHDGRQGACGCGYDGSDQQFTWSSSKYTAAANQLFFDQGGAQWCGQSCGLCVNLTTTGGSAPGGVDTAEGQSHVFMVVDLCPNEAPNLEWCAQTQNHPVNRYGYGAHFDLENGVNQITQGLNWDNVEVTYQVVNCDNAVESMTPTNQKYHQCECYKLSHGK
ncbi:hypothetical protein ACF0H5_018019 [Mactra antiquata]